MIEEKGTTIQTSTFDLQTLAAGFPPSAETMLLDMRLTDEAAASSRLFRIYRPVPAHFHKTCDEYLQVITGRGIFVVDEGRPSNWGQDSCFSSGATWCTAFRKSSRRLSWSSLSTRRGAIRRMFISSIPPTARQRASSARSSRIRDGGRHPDHRLNVSIRNHPFSPAINDAVAHASAFNHGALTSTQPDFHSYGWAAGPCKLSQMSNFYCHPASGGGLPCLATFRRKSDSSDSLHSASHLKVWCLSAHFRGEFLIFVSSYVSFVGMKRMSAVGPQLFVSFPT